MRPALDRAHAVDERHLLELPLGRRHADLPPRAHALNHAGHGRRRRARRARAVGRPALSRRRPKVQVHVLGERAHGHPLPVEHHLHAAPEHPGHVQHPLLHKRHSVGLERLALAHVEFWQVRREGDARPVLLPGAGRQLGRGAGRHVGAEDLAVAQARARAVGRLDDKLRRKDVGELGAVAVAPARDLFFAVVVVRGGQEVPEDELGDVDPLVLVHLDRDAAAVVLDDDPAGGGVDVDAQGVHARVADLVVGGVDEDLVEDLVEARGVGDLAEGEAGPALRGGRGGGRGAGAGARGGQRVAVKDPERGRLLLGGADVGVGAQEDVLELRQLLVDVLDLAALVVVGGGRAGFLGGGGSGARVAVLVAVLLVDALHGPAAGAAAAAAAAAELGRAAGVVAGRRAQRGLLLGGRAGRSAGGFLRGGCLAAAALSARRGRRRVLAVVLKVRVGLRGGRVGRAVAVGHVACCSGVSVCVCLEGAFETMEGGRVRERFFKMLVAAVVRGVCFFFFFFFRPRQGRTSNRGCRRRAGRLRPRKEHGRRHPGARVAERREPQANGQLAASCLSSDWGPLESRARGQWSRMSSARVSVFAYVGGRA